MDTDPTRMCELLVGLGDMEVLGVDDEAGDPLRLHIRRLAEIALEFQDPSLPPPSRPVVPHTIGIIIMTRDQAEVFGGVDTHKDIHVAAGQPLTGHSHPTD